MDLINKYLQEQTPGHEYEYDYEGDMAKTQLNMMMDAASELKSMLANDANLPEWVQSKITKAADYIDSARDYMKNMNKDSNGSMHNEPMGEEMKRDTGWKPSQTDRKDEYGNRIRNVARRLARQGMQSAVKDLKKGPEAGKRQVEEVEDLEELKKDTLNKYITRTRFSSDPKRRMGAQKAMAKVGQKPKEEKPVSEALDEEIGYSPRGHRDLATHHFNKAKEFYQKADSAENSGDSYGADHLNDIASKHASAHYAHKEASTDPEKSAEAHKASREANSMIESVEELDELKKSTYASYADKAEKDIKAKKDEFKAQGGQMRKKSQRDLDAKISNRYKGLFAAQRKAGLPSGFKEEVELDEEMSHSELADKHHRLFQKNLHAAIRLSDDGLEDRANKHSELAYKHADARDYHMKAAKSMKSESVELDEALRHKIAGAIGQFIGNKIDPVHGEIMRLHGEEAYRQAAYHIRKTLSGLHDTLKKHLSSGKLQTEEVEDLDELDKSTLASYAKKATHDARIKHGIGKDFERISKSSRKPEYKQSAKEWEDKYKLDARRREAGVNKAIDRLAKEEVELEESGGDVVWKKGNDHIEKYGDEKFALYKDGKKTKFYKSVGDAKAALSEGKYGSFRVRTTSGTFGGPKLPRRPYVSQGDKDPRTGLPLGFSNPPEKSEKPETNQSDRLDKVKKALRT